MPASSRSNASVTAAADTYLAELRRVGLDDAWPATKDALKAVGLSILIELVATLCAASTWAAGVVLT